LGDGTYESKFAQIKVGIDNDWSAIAAGYGTSLALKSNGTLWEWGQLEFMTDGSIRHNNVPKQVGDDTDWIQLDCGGGQTWFAIKEDETLWSWGFNFNGELGDDSSVSYRPVPSQVGADDQWVAVSAGYTFALGLKADGTLWGWGANEYGQLGDGTTTKRTMPVQIGNDNRRMQLTRMAIIHLP
jgi:alpha-tubulin suppressor-like RCC1 family protein